MWPIGAENTTHLSGNFLHFADSSGSAPPTLGVTAHSWNRRQDGLASQQDSTSKVATENQQDGLALVTHGVLAWSGPVSTVELSSPMTNVELSGVTTAELSGVKPVAMFCCPMPPAGSCESSGPAQLCQVATTAERSGVTTVTMSSCPKTLAESSGPTHPGLVPWHRRHDGLDVAGWRQVAGHWRSVAEHMVEPL